MRLRSASRTRASPSNFAKRLLRSANTTARSAAFLRCVSFKAFFTALLVSLLSSLRSLARRRTPCLVVSLANESIIFRRISAFDNTLTLSLATFTLSVLSFCATASTFGDSCAFAAICVLEVGFLRAVEAPFSLFKESSSLPLPFLPRLASAIFFAFSCASRAFSFAFVAFSDFDSSTFSLTACFTESAANFLATCANESLRACSIFSRIG